MRWNKSAIHVLRTSLQGDDAGSVADVLVDSDCPVVKDSVLLDVVRPDRLDFMPCMQDPTG